MNSELIYQALFNLLSNIDGVVTKSRRLRHFNHVTPEERPALFVVQGNQTEIPLNYLDAKIELEADVYIYIYEADKTVPPSVQLNQIIDKVRNVIAPEFQDIDERQTLGGLVEHCWIEGTIEVFEAAENMLDDHGIAIVPIRILTTN